MATCYFRDKNVWIASKRASNLLCREPWSLICLLKLFSWNIYVKPDSLIALGSCPRAAIWMHHRHRISTQNNFAGIKNLSILLSILTVSSAQFNSFVKLNSICSNSLLECRDVRKLLCFCAEGDRSLFHSKALPRALWFSPTHMFNVCSYIQIAVRTNLFITSSQLSLTNPRYVN